jgi:hypothetical protein
MLLNAVDALVVGPVPRFVAADRLDDAVRVCSIPRRQLLGLPRGFWLYTAAALFAAGGWP